MPPDFLNSREDAVLIWSAIVLAYAIYKSPRLIASTFSVVCLALKPPLLFLFGGAAIYCAGILVAANELGAWNTLAAKETVYWFIGTGLVLAGQATQARPSPDYARALLGRAFKVALVIEFVVNLYVFPPGRRARVCARCECLPHSGRLEPSTIAGGSARCEVYRRRASHHRLACPTECACANRTPAA